MPSARGFSSKMYSNGESDPIFVALNKIRSTREIGNQLFYMKHHKDSYDERGFMITAKSTLSLDRQRECLASEMGTNIPANVPSNILFANEGCRQRVMKLAARMVLNFFSGLGARSNIEWTPFSESDDVRMMTRINVNDPGSPSGIALTAAHSFRLPNSPKRVFDYLRDENNRSQWDILSYNGVAHEMAHLVNGGETGNKISLLRVTPPSSPDILILQESITDPVSSFVIYAPIDFAAMTTVLNGGDPNNLEFLCSGFSVLPDGLPNSGRAGSGGSLITVQFQILISLDPTTTITPPSVAIIKNFISFTIDKIKAALPSEAP